MRTKVAAALVIVGDLLLLVVSAFGDAVGEYEEGPGTLDRAWPWVAASVVVVLIGFGLSRGGARQRVRTAAVAAGGLLLLLGIAEVTGF